VMADETNDVIEGFDGINLHVPKWATATHVDWKGEALAPSPATPGEGWGEGSAARPEPRPPGTREVLRLENRDPYDYVTATRVFPQSRHVAISFKILAEQSAGRLDVELLTKFGSKRPVRITIPHSTQWQSFEIHADAQRATYSMLRNGQAGAEEPFAEPAEQLHCICFRMGEHRNVGGANPVELESDRPAEPVAFRIRDLRITTET